MPEVSSAGIACRCNSPRPSPRARNSFKPWDAQAATWRRGMNSKPRSRLTCGGWQARSIRTWLVEWIKDPKAYWPATKMPNFRLSWEESEAAAAYLLSSSAPYTRPQYPGNGDVEAGKKLVEEIGCLGCHQINGTGNVFAPDLSRVAGKVQADWLFAWVKNPAGVSAADADAQFPPGR